jgi:hypothetical protein
MKNRIAAGFATVLLAVNAHAAQPDNDPTFGMMLSLVQSFMGAALEDSKTGTERAVPRLVDQMLAGKHSEANRLFSGMFAELPAGERTQFEGITSQMRELAQIESRREATSGVVQRSERHAIDARKELASIGLTYHNNEQFLAAVKRGDLIAARLFVAGQGVDLTARDGDGQTASEIASKHGSQEMWALVK